MYNHVLLLLCIYTNTEMLVQLRAVTHSALSSHIPPVRHARQTWNMWTNHYCPNRDSKYHCFFNLEQPFFHFKGTISRHIEFLWAFNHGKFVSLWKYTRDEFCLGNPTYYSVCLLLKTWRHSCPSQSAQIASTTTNQFLLTLIQQIVSPKNSETLTVLGQDYMRKQFHYSIMY